MQRVRLRDHWATGARCPEGDDDESSGRAICARLRLCKAIVSHARHSQDRMLASNGMRLARELRSPLSPGARPRRRLALPRAATPGLGSLPWLGLAALLSSACALRDAEAAGRRRRVPPARRASRLWCALSIAWSIEPDRSWSYANRTFVYLAFALVGAYLGAESAPAPLRVLGPARRGLRLVARSARSFPGSTRTTGGSPACAGPVGYWNASLCSATSRCRSASASRPAERTAGTLLVYGWLVVIGLTYSRGGRPRRGGGGRALDGALEGLDRGALDAPRSRAPRRRRARRRLLPLRADERRAAACDPCSRRDRLRRRAARQRADRRRRLPASSCRRTSLVRRLVASRSWPSLAAAALVVGRDARAIVVAERSRARERRADVTHRRGGWSRSGSNFRWAWWTAGLARASQTKPTRGNRRRIVSVHEPALPQDEPRPDDRAARLPLQFLSETGIVGLLLFLGSIGWLVVRGRRRPGPQLALALALPAYLPARPARHRLGFHLGLGPVFLIAGALAVRPSTASARRVRSPPSP